jgi:hypothetical protein
MIAPYHPAPAGRNHPVDQRRTAPPSAELRSRDPLSWGFPLIVGARFSQLNMGPRRDSDAKTCALDPVRGEHRSPVVGDGQPRREPDLDKSQSAVPQAVHATRRRASGRRKRRKGAARRRVGRHRPAPRSRGSHWRRRPPGVPGRSRLHDRQGDGGDHVGRGDGRDLRPRSLHRPAGRRDRRVGPGRQRHRRTARRRR